MDGNQNKSWFDKFFSLDEFRVSGLIVALSVFLFLDVYSFLKNGDIMPNLLMANAYVIGGISGVSLVGMAINGYGNRNMNQYGSQYNQYGYNNSSIPYSNSSMGMSGMGMNQMPINNMNNGMTNNSSMTPIGQQVISTPTTTSTAQNMQRGI